MRRVKLGNCPEGLFIFDGKHIGLKTEYVTTTSDGRRQSDAYVVASGEYFWGGAKTAEEREKLLVTPIPYDAAISAFLPPPPGDGQ